MWILVVDAVVVKVEVVEVEGSAVVDIVEVV